MADEVSITINDVSYPILCGKCREAVAFIGEGDAEHGEVGCVDCNNVDDVKQVAAMAIQFAKDEGQLIVNRMARDAAKKVKFMTFSGPTEHTEEHRFIVDLKL